MRHRSLQMLQQSLHRLGILGTLRGSLSRQVSAQDGHARGQHRSLDTFDDEINRECLSLTPQVVSLQAKQSFSQAASQEGEDSAVSLTDSAIKVCFLNGSKPASCRIALRSGH